MSPRTSVVGRGNRIAHASMRATPEAAGRGLPPPAVAAFASMPTTPLRSDARLDRRAGIKVEKVKLDDVEHELDWPPRPWSRARIEAADEGRPPLALLRLELGENSLIHIACHLEDLLGGNWFCGNLHVHEQLRAKRFGNHHFTAQPT